MDIHILSESRAVRFEPSGGGKAVMIRVTEPGYAFVPLLHAEKFADVLELSFHDVCSPAEGRSDIAAFDETMAKSAIQFFEAHKNAETFVLHCAAGISRSPALALALSWFAGDKELEDYILYSKRYVPNFLVASVMSEMMHFEDRMSSFEKFHPANNQQREDFNW